MFLSRGLAGRQPDVVPQCWLRHDLPHLHGDQVPGGARHLPHLRQGVLQSLLGHLAPRPLLRRERGLPSEAGRGRGRPRHVDRPDGGGEHQEVPHVRRPHREGRRLCPDDVQAVQARFLLVLSGQS